MKVFAPKRYEKKRIANLLEGKDARQKAIIKARELSKVKLPQKFTVRGIDVDVIRQPVEFDGDLYVYVIASRNGTPLYVNNPLIFRNPPIMIPDGTFHKEHVPDIEREIQRPNLVEDPEGALKEIITQTIEVLNK